MAVTLRIRVADALALALTDVDVLPVPRIPDELARPRVVLGPRSLEPAGTACPGIGVGISAWCLTPLTDVDHWPDALDQLAGDVTDALDAAGFPWSSCTYGVVGNWHAYSIDIDTDE